MRIYEMHINTPSEPPKKIWKMSVLPNAVKFVDGPGISSHTNEITQGFLLALPEKINDPPQRTAGMMLRTVIYRQGANMGEDFAVLFPIEYLHKNRAELNKYWKAAAPRFSKDIRLLHYGGIIRISDMGTTRSFDGKRLYAVTMDIKGRAQMVNYWSGLFHGPQSDVGFLIHTEWQTAARQEIATINVYRWSVEPSILTCNPTALHEDVPETWHPLLFNVLLPGINKHDPANIGNAMHEYRVIRVGIIEGLHVPQYGVDKNVDEVKGWDEMTSWRRSEMYHIFVHQNFKERVFTGEELRAPYAAHQEAKTRVAGVADLLTLLPPQYHTHPCTLDERAFVFDPSFQTRREETDILPLRMLIQLTVAPPAVAYQDADFRIYRRSFATHFPTFLAKPGIQRENRLYQEIVETLSRLWLNNGFGTVDIHDWFEDRLVDMENTGVFQRTAGAYFNYWKEHPDFYASFGRLFTEDSLVASQALQRAIAAYSADRTLNALFIPADKNELGALIAARILDHSGAIEAARDAFQNALAAIGGFLPALNAVDQIDAMRDVIREFEALPYPLDIQGPVTDLAIPLYDKLANFFLGNVLNNTNELKPLFDDYKIQLAAYITAHTDFLLVYRRYRDLVADFVNTYRTRIENAITPKYVAMDLAIMHDYAQDAFLENIRHFFNTYNDITEQRLLAINVADLTAPNAVTIDEIFTKKTAADRFFEAVQTNRGLFERGVELGNPEAAANPNNPYDVALHTYIDNMRVDVMHTRAALYGAGGALRDVQRLDDARYNALDVANIGAFTTAINGVNVAEIIVHMNSAFEWRLFRRGIDFATLQANPVFPTRCVPLYYVHHLNRDPAEFLHSRTILNFITACRDLQTAVQPFLHDSGLNVLIPPDAMYAPVPPAFNFDPAEPPYDLTDDANAFVLRRNTIENFLVLLSASYHAFANFAPGGAINTLMNNRCTPLVTAVTNADNPGVSIGELRALDANTNALFANIENAFALFNAQSIYADAIRGMTHGHDPGRRTALMQADVTALQALVAVIPPLGPDREDIAALTPRVALGQNLVDFMQTFDRANLAPLARLDSGALIAEALRGTSASAVHTNTKAWFAFQRNATGYRAITQHLLYNTDNIGGVFDTIMTAAASPIANYIIYPAAPLMSTGNDFIALFVIADKAQHLLKIVYADLTAILAVPPAPPVLGAPALRIKTATRGEANLFAAAFRTIFAKDLGVPADGDYPDTFEDLLPGLQVHDPGANALVAYDHAAEAALVAPFAAAVGH